MGSRGSAPWGASVLCPPGAGWEGRRLSLTFQHSQASLSSRAGQCPMQVRSREGQPKLRGCRRSRGYVGRKPTFTHAASPFLLCVWSPLYFLLILFYK